MTEGVSRLAASENARLRLGVSRRRNRAMGWGGGSLRGWPKPGGDQGSRASIGVWAGVGLNDHRRTSQKRPGGGNDPCWRAGTWSLGRQYECLHTPGRNGTEEGQKTRTGQG